MPPSGLMSPGGLMSLGGLMLPGGLISQCCHIMSYMSPCVTTCSFCSGGWSVTNDTALQRVAKLKQYSDYRWPGVSDSV